MATSATTFFGNRARAYIGAVGSIPAAQYKFEVDRGFEITISWEPHELYGTDSIIRVDQAKTQLKVEVKLKGCKFDPSVVYSKTGMWHELMYSLNSFYPAFTASSTCGGTIQDTTYIASSDIAIYIAGSGSPTDNVLKFLITNAYLDNVPIPFSENDFVILDLTFHGATCAITNTAESTDHP